MRLVASCRLRSSSGRRLRRFRRLRNSIDAGTKRRDCLSGSQRLPGAKNVNVLRLPCDTSQAAILKVLLLCGAGRKVQAPLTQRRLSRRVEEYAEDGRQESCLVPEWLGLL